MMPNTVIWFENPDGAHAFLVVDLPLIKVRKRFKSLPESVTICNFKTLMSGFASDFEEPIPAENQFAEWLREHFSECTINRVTDLNLAERLISDWESFEGGYPTIPGETYNDS